MGWRNNSHRRWLAKGVLTRRGESRVARTLKKNSREGCV
jgi:hypothetical protein